jgi:hypothetical protein
VKNVVLFRSQLLAIVPDGMVFKRPFNDLTDITPEQRLEDDKVRYRAWEEIAFIPEGGDVYAGECDGQRVYVALSAKIYSCKRYPCPVRTKAMDDEAAFEAEQAAKLAAKRQARTRAKQDLFKRYEIIPKEHHGVNYGTEQRVLIRTKNRVLTYRPGYSSYMDRGAGTEYHRAEFSIYTYEKFKPVSQRDKEVGLGYVLEFGSGPDIPTPHGFKMSPKHLLPLFTTFEQQLGLPLGTLKATGWCGEKTLMLI